MEWARTRARVYPDAVAAAHGRHTLPYTICRAAEVASAGKPRPGDFHGRECRCAPCVWLLGEAS
ncbi:MAG: hypothetical protein ACRDP9_25880 [Kribbellaceae bacterium]